MTQQDEFVLIVGDFCIPTLCMVIPTELKQYLVPGKIDHVLCTGNIGDDKTLQMIKKVSHNFATVRGTMDTVS